MRIGIVLRDSADAGNRVDGNGSVEAHSLASDRQRSYGFAFPGEPLMTRIEAGDIEEEAENAVNPHCVEKLS